MATKKAVKKDTRTAIEKKIDRILAKKENKRTTKDKEFLEANLADNPIIEANLFYINTCGNCNRKLGIIRRARKNGRLDPYYMDAEANCGLSYRQVPMIRVYSWHPVPTPAEGVPTVEWNRRIESGRWNKEVITIGNRKWDVCAPGTVLLQQRQAPSIKRVFCLGCRASVKVEDFKRLSNGSESTV